MANKHGTVYLRGKTWTIGFTLNGQRVREGVGPSKHLAEMVLRKRMAEVLEGRYFPRREAQGQVPFCDFSNTYLERVTSQQKGQRAERIRVLRWVRHFGKRPLSSITRTELEDWQRWKRQRARPATVNRDLCRLRHMLNKACEWGVLAESPMKGLKFLPENNARHRFLTLEQSERLVAACIAPWARAITIVALHTGMRLGEILSLRRQDVDHTCGFILVPDSKNGEPRHIPMDSTVSHVLAQYPRRPNTDLIFSNSASGRRLEIREAFRNARRRAGLEWLHFHDLRHTFASHWMMNGGDLYVLKDILGHKTIAMTQRYAHLSPEYKRAAINRMDNMWKGAGQLSEGASGASLDHSSVTERAQARQLTPAAQIESTSDAGLTAIA